MRNCGTANELKSNTLNATAAPASPEFLYLSAAADGSNPVAAVTTDGGFVGVPGSIPGANLRPAKAGDILVVYALGLGATDPAQTVGVPAPGIGSVTLPVSITIGGVSARGSGHLVCRASAPRTSASIRSICECRMASPSGNQPMVIQLGGAKSPSGGYLTIQ